MKTIRVGLGEIVSNFGTSNGKPALIIEPALRAGPIGHNAPESNDDPLHEDAIIFEIHDAGGVEVLVDDLRKALESNGWHVPASIVGGPLFGDEK